MLRRFVSSLAAAAAVLLLVALPAAAEQRIALVIGNAAYAKGPLKTSLADGGLVAEALTSIGFEIVEGADTNATDLRRVFRDFLEKVQAAGPDTIALVYYTGYALQFEGENYLVPVDARLERDSDIPIDTMRLFDVMRPLADAPALAKIVILDATRPLPFQIQGGRLARGLGAVATTPGMLVALSSAPGTVAEDGDGPYGAYAQAVAEMVREAGLDLDTLFARIRVRTHQATNGVQTPWHVASVDAQIMLVPGDPPQAVVTPGTPPPAAAPRRAARPMRDYGAEDGYAYAIERDDLDVYVQYVRTYPNSPYAQRIWATIRARREALAWRHALLVNSPDAYWTYLQRYPRGMYVSDAERRLRRLSAGMRPPSGFRAMDFDDAPPALDDEDRYEDDNYIRRGPPPPRLLAPPPAFIVGLPPPSRPGGPGGLWRRPNPAFPQIVNPGPGPGPGWQKGPGGPGGPQWQKGGPKGPPGGPAVVTPGGPGGPGMPGGPSQWQKGGPKGPPGGPAVVTPGGPPPSGPGLPPPVGFKGPPGGPPGGPGGPKGPPAGTKGPAVVTTPPPTVTPPPGPPPGTNPPPVGFKGPPGGPPGGPGGPKGPPAGTKGPAVVTTPPANTSPPGGTPPVGFGAPKGPPPQVKQPTPPTPPQVKQVAPPVMQQKGPPPGPPGGPPPVGFGAPKGPPPQVNPPPQVKQMAPPVVQPKGPPPGPPPGGPPPVGFGAPKGPPQGAVKGPPQGLPKCAVTGGKQPCAP